MKIDQETLELLMDPDENDVIPWDFIEQGEKEIQGYWHVRVHIIYRNDTLNKFYRFEQEIGGGKDSNKISYKEVFPVIRQVRFFIDKEE